MIYTPYFASTYGAGSYNTATYNNTSTAASTATSTAASGASSTGTSGMLANTGFDLILGATIGSVIIVSAILIRVWKRPSKRPDSANL